MTADASMEDSTAADFDLGEAPTFEEAEPAGPLTPAQVLRDHVETRIVRTEGELALIERQYRQWSARIEDARARLDQAETIKALIAKSPGKYGGDELRGAFDEIAQAQAALAVAEQRYDEIGERRTEAKERIKAYREDLELVAEAARDAAVRAPEEEALTFRNASRQVFQIIEEERMRIARDMHDGPAQSMSNLVLQAEILERLVGRNPDQMLSELQDFKNSVRNALEETRQLIFDLRPMTLDDLGLVPTLRKYVKEYGDKYGFTTRFNVVGEERRLPGSTEGTLFRIIQEALTNVQKHAHARTAEITLNLGKDRVLAVIRDDGAGFDVAKVETNLARNRNLGLISMRERAELERGTLEIKSTPGKGTEIRIEVRVE
jgi:two-component system sensor histidine kinase DegS